MKDAATKRHPFVLFWGRYQNTQNRPLCFPWNSSKYFYTTNLQGDVVAIVSMNGNPVVKYTYDAWGNVLSVTGTRADNLGRLNPLRYRGYVYDTETGLYYLQSRYYNPEWGRFINGDDYVSTGQGMLSSNMFAYCENNPVNGTDPCGTCFHRWDFWNNCESCGGGNWAEDILDYMDRVVAINTMQQNINTQVQIAQNEMIADAAEAMWDAYVHSIELQVQEQHNQASTIVGIVEDIAADPKGAVDWITGVGGLGLGVLGTSATLGIISIPVAGQVAIGIAGLACSVWGVGRLARLW